VRIDKEAMGDADGAWIIYNYGHGGWGYQGSYGCAEGVVQLVNGIRKEKGEHLGNEPGLFSWDDL
jgi:D-amino-acid oxidase